ncbi:MAG: hypothetical protein KF691_09300 [Phycisphaeraceae bacterium]|nr:hypothetical protein [Phycisphaeraceae bacterium]
MLERSRSWLQGIRLKALAVVMATVLAAIGVIAWSTLPAWPVIGVGVAIVAVALNHVAVRLHEPMCWSCGHSMKSQPIGQHGSICPSCGAVNQPLLTSDEEARNV